MAEQLIVSGAGVLMSFVALAAIPWGARVTRELVEIRQKLSTVLERQDRHESRLRAHTRQIGALRREADDAAAHRRQGPTP
mgnify:CR=1 FL=1